MDNTSASRALMASPDSLLNEHSTPLAARVNAACITFLVVVPLTIVALLVQQADADYPGYNGSSPDCKIAGYPTNIDQCLSSH